jgi:hypothetical protein
MKRSAGTSVSQLQDADDLSHYNYGFINLPDNCIVKSMNIDGQKDLHACHNDDIINLSNASVVMKMIYGLDDDAPYNMMVYTDTSERDGYTLAEYHMVFQFPTGTRLKYESFALVLEINKTRINPRSIVGYFDEKIKMTCITFTLASVKNPILIVENILVSQCISLTLMNTDTDGLSSKDNSAQVSITRKRSRKSDVKYEKLCEK